MSKNRPSCVGGLGKIPEKQSFELALEGPIEGEREVRQGRVSWEEAPAWGKVWTCPVLEPSVDPSLSHTHTYFLPTLLRPFH